MSSYTNACLIPLFYSFFTLFTLLILFIELYHLLMLNANIFIIPFFHSRPPKGTLFLLGSHIGSQLLFVFLPFHHYLFMLYLHTLICYSTTFYLFWSILRILLNALCHPTLVHSLYFFTFMHRFILLLCLKHFNALIRPTTMLKTF